MNEIGESINGSKELFPEGEFFGPLRMSVDEKEVLEINIITTLSRKNKEIDFILIFLVNICPKVLYEYRFLNSIKNDKCVEQTMTGTYFSAGLLSIIQFYICNIKFINFKVHKIVLRKGHFVLHY